MENISIKAALSSTDGDYPVVGRIHNPEIHHLACFC
jgi:hypothetical protein